MTRSCSRFRGAVVLDADGLAGEEAVAVAAVLRRVHGEDGLVSAAFLDPDCGVGGQPVVGVNHVEAADVILHCVEDVDERAAHVVDFVHEISGQIEAATVVVDAIDEVVVGLAVTNSGEDVNFVAAALKRGGEFADVDSHAADGDGMKGLP